MTSRSPAPDAIGGGPDVRPQPSAVDKSSARFVLLYHELPNDATRTSHFDLMLEEGATLRTWALDDDPTVRTNCQGVELAPHRLAYLEYEGPISGNRGSVRRVDAGAFEWRRREAERLEISFSGRHLQGSWRFTLNPLDQRWSLEKLTDDSAIR